jgi:hypothetical protein
MKVIVDRQTWLRGEGSEESWLRRKADGKQCCLGFAGHELGCSIETLAQMKTLSEIPWPKRTHELQQLLDRPGTFAALGRAMALNDVIGLQDYVREWAIQQALTPIGLEVEFIN